MKPIDLFRFVLDEDVWTLTSGDTSIVYNSETYVPAEGLKRSDPEIRNEISRANLEVELDVLHALSQTLLTGFLERVLTLTVYTQDQELASTSITWKGRLSSQKPLKKTLKLSFESVFTSLRRPGLRARYQKTCRHVLYQNGCNLSASDFAIQADVTAIAGTSVTATQAGLQADGYFTGGMIQYGQYYGYIINHVGTALTLQRPLRYLEDNFNLAGYGQNYGNLYGGDAVYLYPGCNRTRQICLSKFNNLLNFGGFPWIPSRNPFDGSSIV